MSTRAIVAVTNEAVKEWNIRIQQMNDEQTYPLYSVDRLCEDVDDPNDHLKNMLTEEILHNFNNAGCLPHLLNLKRNDVCILLRDLDKSAGLTNNRRVQILAISRFVIKVKTLGDR